MDASPKRSSRRSAASSGPPEAVLTKDQRIRYRTLEREALTGAGVAAFVLVGKDLTGEQMGAAFVRALPALRKMLVSTDKPFIARVGRDGSVSVLSGYA